MKRQLNLPALPAILQIQRTFRQSVHSYYGKLAVVALVKDNFNHPMV